MADQNLDEKLAQVPQASEHPGTTVTPGAETEAGSVDSSDKTDNTPPTSTQDGAYTWQNPARVLDGDGSKMQYVAIGVGLLLVIIVLAVILAYI